MPFLRSFTVEYLHPCRGLCVCLACVLCALLRLCGCDRLPSVSVVPSVCPVGSAAVRPRHPYPGGEIPTPPPPSLNLLSTENKKNETFYRNILTDRNICDIISSPTKKRGNKMKASTAVREIMALNNETIPTLMDKLSIKYTTLSERLRQDNISVEKLDQMVRAMGYKIVLMPSSTKEEKGWYRVE